jgi:hypothetical protein
MATSLSSGPRHGMPENSPSPAMLAVKQSGTLRFVRIRSIARAHLENVGFQLDSSASRRQPRRRT